MDIWGNRKHTRGGSHVAQGRHFLSTRGGGQTGGGPRAARSRNAHGSDEKRKRGARGDLGVDRCNYIATPPRRRIPAPYISMLASSEHPKFRWTKNASQH